MSKTQRPDPQETFYGIRDGVVYVNAQNQVVMVGKHSARRTHLGRLASGAFEKYEGQWGVLFAGRTLDMVYSNPVDAGLNLLEVLNAPEGTIYGYWSRNRNISTRKLSPGVGHGTMVGRDNLPPLPPAPAPQPGNASPPRPARTRGRHPAASLSSLASDEPADLPPGTFDGLLPEG